MEPPHVGCYQFCKAPVLHAKRYGRSAWRHLSRLRDFRVVPPNRPRTERERFQSRLSACSADGFQAAFRALRPKLHVTEIVEHRKKSHPLAHMLSMRGQPEQRLRIFRKFGASLPPE